MNLGCHSALARTQRFESSQASSDVFARTAGKRGGEPTLLNDAESCSTGPAVCRARREAGGSPLPAVFLLAVTRKVGVRIILLGGGVVVILGRSRTADSAQAPIDSRRLCSISSVQAVTGCPHALAKFESSAWSLDEAPPSKVPEGVPHLPWPCRSRRVGGAQPSLADKVSLARKGACRSMPSEAAVEVEEEHRSSGACATALTSALLSAVAQCPPGHRGRAGGFSVASGYLWRRSQNGSERSGPSVGGPQLTTILLLVCGTIQASTAESRVAVSLAVFGTATAGRCHSGLVVRAPTLSLMYDTVFPRARVPRTSLCRGLELAEQRVGARQPRCEVCRREHAYVLRFPKTDQAACSVTSCLA